MSKTLHEKYAAQVRAEGRTATPYRIGIAVGAAGENLPSPYPAGSRGDHSYLDGVEFGRTERRINAKAEELYEESIFDERAPTWAALNGAQRWPWRARAIEALANPPGAEGRS